jgi:hypothetical protein
MSERLGPPGLTASGRVTTVRHALAELHGRVYANEPSFVRYFGDVWVPCIGGAGCMRDHSCGLPRGAVGARLAPSTARTPEYDDAENVCVTGVDERDDTPTGQSSGHARARQPSGARRSGCAADVCGSDRAPAGQRMVAGQPLRNMPSARSSKLEWSITLGRPRSRPLTSEVGGFDSFFTYRIGRVLWD